MPKFVICSSPRTGSHALASALADHPALNVAGEVFVRSEFGVNSIREALERYDGFIHHRTGQCNVPELSSPVIWRELFATKDLFVINLKRRDLLAAIVSLLLAERTGTWQAASRESPVLTGYPKEIVPPRPMRLEPSVVQYWFQMYAGEYAHFDLLIKRSGLPALEVWYEDIANCFDAIIRRVQEFLGVDVQSLVPATQKQEGGLAYVANLDELRSYFLRTQWEPYFEPAAPKRAAALPAPAKPLLSENRIINGLWIGPALSSMEVLTIKSFQDHGHEFCLWVYDEVANVPAGTKVGDASEILPRSAVFEYGPDSISAGSTVGFSDAWRFAFLFHQGGWYVDMDVCCLKPFDFEASVVLRRQNWVGTPTGNICKLPKHHPLAYVTWQSNAMLVGRDNIDFILPMSIFGVEIARHGMQRYLVSPEFFVNLMVTARAPTGDTAIADADRRAAYDTSADFRTSLCDGVAYAIHWCNQAHQWRQMDRSRPAPGTLYESLLRKHGVI